ncbi:Homeobox protein [Salix suchowensis]|nr:Homeobox protein [Salix suchowensis]
MVQLMSSLSRKAAVKLEADDSSEDQLSPLHKRSKLDLSSQVMNADAVLYNRMEEPSPIGLTLKKSQSFLDLIQMKLSQQNTSNAMLSKKPGSAAADKIKASNFTASLLKIGSWECKSRYEGDLVAKCYFAKHKLVWEVLDGGLKNKIEIQWSDIVAIKANLPDDGPETLDVVLARQPLFFRETNPQPRKHTLWQATSDFTGGQASIHRRHFLQCPQGFMGKHYEKLIQCDPRLNFLSQQLEIILESPYFVQRVSAFSDLHESGKGLDSEVEDRTAVFALQEAGPPSGVLSSSLNNEGQSLTCQYPENISQQTSTALVMETRAFEETRSNRTGEQKLPSNCDQIKVPRFHPSISMSNLVNHIGHCISEQMISGNSILSGGDIKSSDILDEITQYLLGDSQVMSASDEKSLVSRVNSLCCLLPKDPATARDLQAKSLSDLDVDRDRGINLDCDRGINETDSATAWACQSKFVEGFAEPEGEASHVKEAPAMSINLPSIASQPQFLFNI